MLYKSWWIEVVSLLWKYILNVDAMFDVSIPMVVVIATVIVVLYKTYDWFYRYVRYGRCPCSCFSGCELNNSEKTLPYIRRIA